MIVMILLLAVIFIFLVACAAIIPRPAAIGAFELERRRKAGDNTALEILRREELLTLVLSLQRALAALFLVLFVAVAVAALGWLLGILFSVLVALEYGRVARAGVVAQKSQQLYEQHEPALLAFIEKHRQIFQLLRSVSPQKRPVPRLESREELEHLVAGAGTLLSPEEKKLVLHGLAFGARKVGEIMTPRSAMDTIDKKELLGPLVLDGLHKTGHSRFPVTDGDADHIVGVLHVQDLLTLDTKRSVTAEKAMEPRVFYIREDHDLRRALAAFLRTRHHLFVVVNEFRETVGIITLEDVIEALLGQKIVDEFDAYDDLRRVAGKNPRANNQPEKHEDV